MEQSEILTWVTYGPPSFKRHNYTVYLYENFRLYSRENSESANLKIICLFIKCSLLVAV